MRREGRPHGMVRTHHVLPAKLNPKPASRIVNPIDAPPTAGLFTKVSNKPTNHSKFTGKCTKVRCSGCHFHPAWKSKDKSKGAHKLKSSDAAVNYQQVTWRVMGPNKLRNSGYSASAILDELNIYYYHHDDDDYDDDVVEAVVHSYVDQEERDMLVENLHDHVADNDEDEVIIHVGVTDDGDDGYVGFYDVAYVWNSVDEDDDEGWFIVGGDHLCL